jgi:hypothetical protein
MAKLGFGLRQRVASAWGEPWVHVLDRSTGNKRSL